MREALGGYLALVIIVLFIAIVSGFMAFSVNYNKAFKMKNKIIAVLEKYKNNPNNSDAQEEIKEYAKQISYNVSEAYKKDCSSEGDTGYTLDKTNTGWCYKIVDVNDESSYGYSDTNTLSDYKEFEKRYVDIKTFVSIDMPIFNNFFSKTSLSSVRGSTKVYTKFTK